MKNNLMQLKNTSCNTKSVALCLSGDIETGSMNMTDDYLAISNTGKNITITMTPGMKQRVLNNIQRVILTCENGYAVITPCGNGLGSKLYKRKRVWNMSVSSRRLANWPKHDRFVVPATGVQLLNFRVVIPLPKPAVDMDSMLRNITEKLRRETPPRS
jgi:hypothetical protein